MHEYKIVAFITPGWAITCCNFVIFTEVKSAIMSEFNVHAFSGMYILCGLGIKKKETDD